MALHRSSKFNAADGLFPEEALKTTEETSGAAKKKAASKAEKAAETAETKAEATEEPEKAVEHAENKAEGSAEAANTTETAAKISIETGVKADVLEDTAENRDVDARIIETAAVKRAPEEAIEPTLPLESPKTASAPRGGKKLSATAIMPRKIPKKASESVINRTYTIDRGTYDLMAALVRFMRDSKVKDEETGYLINESAFIRRAIRTEMDRVFDSNDETFSDAVREYLDKPMKKAPQSITY